MKLGDSIRVVIADAHPVVGAALAESVEAVAGARPVACVTTGAALIELLSEQPVDVVLLDETLAGARPGRRAPLLEFVRATQPDVRVIVLAMNDEPAVHGRTLAAGATDVLPKEMAADLLPGVLGTPSPGIRRG
jgi:two-component system, NarL family, invasion response regulator UvrY